MGGHGAILDDSVPRALASEMTTAALFPPRPASSLRECDLVCRRSIPPSRAVPPSLCSGAIASPPFDQYGAS